MRRCIGMRSAEPAGGCSDVCSPIHHLKTPRAGITEEEKRAELYIDKSAILNAVFVFYSWARAYTDLLKFLSGKVPSDLKQAIKLKANGEQFCE